MKQDWKPGTMIYPLPAVLVSCGKEESEYNMFTVAWTGTICTNPPMCYISVRPERHSYDIIKKNMEFVINLTTKDMAFATDWCGVRSGRDYHKFDEMKLTPGQCTVVSAPLIEESPLCIECRVKEIISLGSHDMFIADVVNVRADDRNLNPETGKLELAEANPKIVGVTPAMPSGCSMNILMSKMPKRAFDVGIAEGHAVTFSGGMSKDGLQPFCKIYSSFMQRAYDNIIHDVAIQNLPVVLCLDRAGLVGEDGPTHHGAFDMAYLRPIPNLTIVSPMDEHELRRLMYTAQLPDKGPFAIRYPRGRGVLVDWKCPLEEIPVGKGRKLKDGKDLAVISIGPIGNKAATAIARAETESGKSIAHYDLRFLKPLDEGLLHEVGRKFRHIVTIEDGVIQGGMGSAVLEFMADHEYTPTVKRIGIPDKFVQHGTIAQLYQLCGMDEDSITKELLKQCALQLSMSGVKELTN